ncbi:lysM domain/BON superfamily protein [bacterium BMS3Abin02]|nr:lysM domain/BON superfamily protein [bacterium BMS3Abin02]GBE23104.1 lysM domain/BON superfamily protein [bacterium BMS3Bbin01]HDH24629.1 LysM peptidoglycan-binding domain-containing protein [Actinomycetota bacterium]HDL49848.1 LysM peptidoglycan-binding domain-containing protein [Actinomycetota bacterium]
MKRIVQLVALVLTEATAIIALVSIGRAPFMKIDLRAADPIDSLMALLRVVALGAVLWLAASTVAYLAAGARRARLPRWFTIPFVRRVVDRAIAVAIVFGAVAQPALATAPAVIVTVDPSGMVLPPGVSAGSAGLGRSPIMVPDVSGTMTPAPTAPATSLSTATTSVTVQVGDNLWKIARRHLQSFGEDPANRRLATYWAKVVDVNRSVLRSGNPDLIYPGETVLLPPI